MRIVVTCVVLLVLCLPLVAREDRCDRAEVAAWGLVNRGATQCDAKLLDHPVMYYLLGHIRGMDCDRAVVLDEVRTGAKLFDENARRRGKKAECREVRAFLEKFLRDDVLAGD